MTRVSFFSSIVSVFLVLLTALTMPSRAQEASDTSAFTPAHLNDAQLTDHQRFARQQLIATIRLYNEHLRVEKTGQYLDNIDTHETRQTSFRSSIASTGVGLISLAISDQLGVLDDAADKAQVTLNNLLGKDATSGFNTPRSKNGWFKHFINVHTGEGLGGSKHVFSTIDTAILGVGAYMTASYFSQKNDPSSQEAARLAQELVDTVNWSQAVRFADNPGIHQVFRGPDEGIENRFWSLLFDEYIILPCIGRAIETRNGFSGRATQFWNEQIGHAGNLPQAQVGDLTLLSIAGRRVSSHFTHQFAFYFCGDLASDPVFQAELNELKQADKRWFEQAGEGRYPMHWWGLGAGSEIKFKKGTREIDYSGYGVARLGKNHHHTFSPAIMAGFLPVEQAGDGAYPPLPHGTSGIIDHLMTLHENDECRYRFAGLDFLWRCTAHDPSLRVQHIEGVDLSTYLLGLAWFDPKVGARFFKDHAVRARYKWPEAREIRAQLTPRAGKR